MGIVYGLYLAELWPALPRWAQLPTGFSAASYGWHSWLLTAMAVGVFLSGARDLHSALSRGKSPGVPP